MPAISLVVCLHNEREFLQRLLQKADGCYDDLVAIHDGPDEAGVRGMVEAAGGRFFERPLERQQEPHWPFAWQQAKHDWILRLDADEFPSEEMKAWLQKFRQSPPPAESLSGFSCVWPLWNGRKTVSEQWPAGHVFLFHRQHIRFFGMAEQGVIPDGQWEPLDFALHHQPKRKSYGLRNIFLRRQAYVWRAHVARCLLGEPGDLPGWRWDRNAGWPEIWEQMRRHPWRTACVRLVRWPPRELRNQWRIDRRFYPVAAICGPLFHALICIEFWRQRRQHLRKTALAKNKINN